MIAATFIIAVMLLAGCGEKKETAGVKDGDKSKTSDSSQMLNKESQSKKLATDEGLKSETSNKTKEDSTMQNETAGKEDPTKSNKSTGNIAKIETTMGTIKIKLFADKAPLTVANFKKLVNEGFYNGVIFHRVIDGFMIQTGDPTGTGTGGSKETIKDEFGAGLKHDKKGMVSMANRGPNTGTSQFFITLAPTPWLDGKHAIFGEVIDGMDVVEKIGKTKTAGADKPVTDIKMTKVTLVDK